MGFKLSTPTEISPSLLYFGLVTLKNSKRLWMRMLFLLRRLPSNSYSLGSLYSMDIRRCIPSCPTEFKEMSVGLQALGHAWAHSEHRPRIDARVLRHWDSLLKAWAESDLPIVVRKATGVRGTA